MLEVFDKGRNKLAILQNAFSVKESKAINAVNHLSFSLPDADTKNEYCQPFNYVRYNGGDLYRIMPSVFEESETGSMNYECEHVIALLIDTVMFGFVTVGGLGYYTRNVLEYVLNRQRPNERHWILDECDFSRQFEYGWEQENLLAALFSVPNRFVDKYIWKFNTDTYPFRLSLKLLDESRLPEHYIRRGHNRIRLIKREEPRQICTRLYPLGAGEGVNQLGIKEVNLGLPYLQSPQTYTDRYGIVERVWVDRRYTDQESLKNAAQAMLNELQEPLVEYETDFIGDCELGDIVQIVGFQKTYITEINIAHEEVPGTSIKIANRPTSIASTVADLADRQRIEMTYSQGATQIYADSIADNASGTIPLELRFYLPDTMININSVMCKIRLSAFRAYSKATASGGNVQTSTSSSSSTSTSNSSTTTSGGGGSANVSGGGKRTSGASSIDFNKWGKISTGTLYTGSAFGPGSHAHAYSVYIDFTGVSLPSSHQHDTDTSFTISLPSHVHSMAHTHDMAHTHTVDTKHGHDIVPGIHYFSSGSNFWLLINGVNKKYFASADAEVDITEYLIKDGKIPRGVWHTIGVLPNALSRVEISYNVQGFIQSRGDVSV